MKRRAPANMYSIALDNPLPPEDFPIPQPDTGEVIALLAEEGPRSHGWSARLAVELAARWSREDVKVLLADGDFSSPSLHELLGEENDEGVADLILYGASCERVAREVGEGKQLFVPSGTVVADPEGAYADPRWARVFSEMRGSSTVLLLYLPAEFGGVSGLVAEADWVIQLALDPPTADVDPDVTVIHSSGGEAPLSETVPVPAMGAGVRSSTESTDVESPVTRVVPKGPTSKRRVAPPLGDAQERLFFVVLFILIVIVLALAWYGYITVPGLTLSSSSLIEPAFSSDSLAPDFYG